MANLFTTLPVPSANGAGAAVDVSAFGAPKTIVIEGSIRATLNVQISTSGAAGPWVTVASFSRNGESSKSEQSMVFAAEFMRVVVSGYVLGSAMAAVGSDDRGAQFVNLPATAGDGAGASVDVSAIGTTGTVVVGGAWRGALNIEISQDGTSWATAASLSSNGYRSVNLVAQFMRVRRAGVPQVAPGLPIVNVGAINDGVAAGAFDAFDELTATGTSLVVTGLEGDAVGAYDIDGLIIVEAFPWNMFFRPNGDSANLRQRYSRNSAAGALRSDWLFAQETGFNGNLPHQCNVSGKIWTSRTIRGVSVRRAILCRSTNGDDLVSSNQHSIVEMGGRYYDNTQELISLEIFCNQQMGVGSWLGLTKASPDLR
jgi:hypothetical protein